MALHWFGEYVSSFFPHGVFLVFRIRRCHRESFPRSQLVVVFVPQRGERARPKDTKINLMDCICLCSEVCVVKDISKGH